MQIFLPASLLVLLIASDAPAQGPYCQGKTVTVIVGSGPSTAHDIYARLLVNYIGKYPGNPNVIAHNMPASWRRIMSTEWPSPTA